MPLRRRKHSDLRNASPSSTSDPLEVSSNLTAESDSSHHPNFATAQPEPDSHGATNKAIPTSQHRFSKRFLLTAVLLILPLVALISAWQWDSRNYQGRVPRNTSLFGVAIGGMNPSQLRTHLALVANQVADTRITFTAPSDKQTIPASEIALQLDVLATETAILKGANDRTGLLQIADWARRLGTKKQATAALTFDRTRLEHFATQLDLDHRTDPREPELAFENDSLIMRSGKEGYGFNADILAKSLQQSATTLPLAVAAKPESLPPTVTPAAAQAFLSHLENLPDFTIGAAGTTAVLTQEDYPTFFRSQAAEKRLVAVVDPEPLQVAITKRLANAGRQPTEAFFTVQNELPVPHDGKPGMICCTPDASQQVRDSLVAFANAENPTVYQRDPTHADPTALGLTEVPPKSRKESLEPLQVKEVIGTYTTHYTPNQPRVKNIERIAQTVRGTLIRPGETYSLNKAVGPRTTAKGYVEDKVIIDGKFEKSVGGGISQFATTLFNAAFFAGLDFGEYQAHTIYIDRYPYGREATISHPHPDLQIKNTSPYGVLLWTSYSANSITVTLYSTTYATGKQTGQRSEPANNCTRVVTERTREYADGRTATDSVRALYQPSEGEKCH